MKYYAFISYNSADEKWAKWLQHSLEYYHVPSALCKEYSNLPKKIRPVFWYKQDLSGTKLKDALSKELENSKFLIVICSPDSAKSEWVNDEVQSFIKQGKGDKIIPFIVGGVPHAKNPNEECFPPALLGLKRDEEIRGIDIRRKEGKWHALVDVIATMFGIRFDELWQRHKKSQRRKIIISLLFLLAIISICIAWRYSVKKELITQAKFIAAEAEKLAEDNNISESVKLLLYVANINKWSLKTAEFSNVIRSLNCNYKMPNKIFRHDNHEFDIDLLDEFKSSIKSATYSPDGKYIVTIGESLGAFISVAKLWSVESGRSLYTLHHNGNIESAHFSLDGRFIATSSWDGTCKIWSIDNGDCVHVLNHNLPVVSAEYSNDGRYIVTASDDGTSKVWDAETGESLHKLDHKGWVNSAKFSPDGKYIVTAARDNTAKIWSVENGECLYTFKHETKVNSANFSPDCKYVVTSLDNATFKLWSMKYGKCLYTFYHKEVNYSPNSYVGMNNSFDFSSDGKYVVTAYWDNTSKIWSLKTGECVMNFDHKDIVTTASFSPDNKYVVTASKDHTSKIWSVETGICMQTMSFTNPKSAGFSPDGNSVIITGPKGIVEIWDVELSKINHKDNIISMDISPNGKYIATVSDGSISSSSPEILKIWDIVNGECINTLNHWGMQNVSFSPDSKLVVTSSIYDTAKIWCIENSECIQTMTHDYIIESAKFSPDGKYVVTASRDNTSKIWCVETGKCLHTLRHKHDVESSEFSPDGRYIVTSSMDNTAKIWSVETGECLHTLNHINWVLSSKFSSDSRYVVTASLDWTSVIWNVESGKCIQTMLHDDPVSYAEFSPDNKKVITEDSKKIGVWSVKTPIRLPFSISKLDQDMLDKRKLIHNLKGSGTPRFDPEGQYIITEYGYLCSVKTGDCLMKINHDDGVKMASFTPDGKYIITASGNVVRKHKLTPLPEILSRWSEILGPNAELTEEEKEKYFLN